jgi:hypothetical protein
MSKDNSYIGIIHFYFYEISGKDIYNILYNNPQKIDEDFYENLKKLPKYTIQDDRLHIVESIDYYTKIKIITENDLIKYICFNYICGDLILDELICNTDITDLLDESGIMPLDLNKIKMNNWDDIMPKPTLITIKQNFYKSWTDYGYEYDSDKEINYYNIKEN